MKTTARLPFEKIRFDLPFRTHLALTLEAPHVEWESPPAARVRHPGHRRLRLDEGRQAREGEEVGPEARRPPGPRRLLRRRHLHHRRVDGRAAHADDPRSQGGAPERRRAARGHQPDQPRRRDARGAAPRERVGAPRRHAASGSSSSPTAAPTWAWPRSRRGCSRCSTPTSGAPRSPPSATEPTPTRSCSATSPPAARATTPSWPAPTTP